MARDYTPLPFEYLEEMDCLSDAEYGRLVRGLQHYSITGEEPKLSGQEKAHWKRVRNRENRYRDSFASSDEERTERARKAANARWGNAKNAHACASMPSNAQNAYTDTEAGTKTDTKAKSLSYHLEEEDAHPRAGAVDQELGKVMTFYMDKINSTPSSAIVSDIKTALAQLDADVIIHAMGAAIDERKTSWSYIRAIIQRYCREGLTTLAAVQESEQQYLQRAEQSAWKRTSPRQGASDPAMDDLEALHRMFSEEEP